MICENCKSKTNFVNDYANGNYICRVCGAVQTKTLFVEQMHHEAHSFNHTSNNNEMQGNFLAMNAHMKAEEYSRALSSEHISLENKPKEIQIENRIRTITCYAELLDANESILNFACVQIRKCPQLVLRKPVKETLYALLVVSFRLKKHFINTETVQKEFLLKSLGKHVIAVSKIVSVSINSDPILQVNRYIQILGLPYKYNKHVRRLYQKGQSIAKMSCGTLLGVILYKVWRANRQFSSRADITPEFIGKMLDLKDNNKIINLI